MEKSPSEFGKALKKAIANIALNQGKNQQLVKHELGVSLGRTGASAIQYWQDSRIPSKPKDIAKLAQALVRQKGITEKTHLLKFLTSSGYPNFGKLYDELLPELSNEATLPLIKTNYDWGEAPTHSDFFGRTSEIQQAEKWIFMDRCRVIAFLGLGGIGKTMLAAQVAQQVSSQFDYVIWRSVREAPPLKIILTGFIEFLSNQNENNIPNNINAQISGLLEYLYKYRCLLILDNLETVMQVGQQVGHYRDGYDDYGRLIQAIVETAHNSCLLLTSRERPKELASFEEDSPIARCHTLLGLASADAQTILRDKPIEGSENDWAETVRLYGGNPLALKVIAGTIRNLFNGKLADFLAEGGIVFGDIRNVLDEQFNRLTFLEQNIMYWLAVERQAVTASMLSNNLILPCSQADLLASFNSLRNRSLIEETSLGFTLQNVVMEYMTNRLVVKCVDEINDQREEILSNIPLAKVTSRDFVREIQLRLIVGPVTDMLLAIWGVQDVEKILKNRLELLHELSQQKPGYDTGNLVTLLTHLKVNLACYNFSNLVIWEANFQNVDLENTNFSGATFERCNFAQIFGMIISIAYSPSGEYVAGGTHTGDILMWELKTRCLIVTFRGHTDWVRALCFSENGLELFSASDDQTVRMWNTKTGDPMKIFIGHQGRVMTIAIDCEKQIMVSGGEDSLIRIWDIPTGNLLKEFVGGDDNDKWLFSLKFSPNKKFLLSASGDTTVRLWETNSYTCIRKIKGHKSFVWTAAFSRDGSFIASGGNDGTIRIWRGRGGSPIRTINVPDTQVRCLAISPQGDSLVSANSDSHLLRVWDVKTGQSIKILAGHESILWAVAFSQKGDVLASGGNDHTLRLWDTQNMESIFSFKGYSMAITSIAFSPVDPLILLSTCDDGVVRMWNVETGQNQSIFKKADQFVWKAVFNPIATMIACSFGSGLVHLLDVQTGKILRSVKDDGKPFGMSVFSPDGQMLITGGNKASIWDINTASLITTLTTGFETYYFAFAPEKGWLLLSGETGRIQCWNIERQELLHVFEGHSSVIWSLSVDRTTQRLASASSDHTVRIWDLGRKEQIAVLEGHHDQVKTISFHPNGQILASGGYDNKIRIWDAETFDCLHVLEGHSDTVWNIAFNIDGQILASGSRDGTIRIWETTTFECIKILRPNRPYEKMNITKARGLTETQKENLLALGAIDEEALMT